MATDVQKGKAVTFRVRPPSLWSGPSGSVLSPAGESLETPSPSVDSASTTVASASAPDVMTLTDATGFARGRVYRFTGDWGYAYAELAQVDGNDIELVEPLPTTPTAGDAVEGVEITIAVSSTSTATLGMGYRAIVTDTSGAEESVYFNVVLHPWQSPLEPRHVRAHLARWWPSDDLLEDEEECQNIADKAGRLLRGRLLGTGSYPHLFFDPDSLEEAGDVALELVLARRGFVPPGTPDPGEYKREIDLELKERVQDIAKSAHPYDEDDDDELDDDEESGVFEGEWYR